MASDSIKNIKPEHLCDLTLIYAGIRVTRACAVRRVPEASNHSARCGANVSRGWTARKNPPPLRRLYAECDSGFTVEQDMGMAGLGAIYMRVDESIDGTYTWTAKA